MPRRVVPKAYETPPSFYGGAEMYEEPPRDELGRFTFAGTKVKDPSATMAPTPEEKRPRTHRVSYNSQERTLRIQFRNGKVYGYYDVPPNIWRDLKGVASTGKFINRRLDPFFEYSEEWPGDV